jgi:phospholipase/carboxylesterase
VALTIVIAALVLLAVVARAAAEPRADAPAVPNRYRCGLATFETKGATGAPLVLLHGYGSAAEEWFQFIAKLHPPDGGRMVFPTGPNVTQPPDGPAGKRGWWRLRLDTYVPAGSKLPDLSQARPGGLDRATRSIRLLVQELEQRQHLLPGSVILGGFSQGAMVAANLAFKSTTPLRAVVLLSPTPVDERAWVRGLAHRRGLPVFIAHGRNDEILPYAGSERLQQQMTDAGLAVTFVPFDGGHEIPAPVVDALNEFLAKLPPLTQTAGAAPTGHAPEKLAR